MSKENSTGDGIAAENNQLQRQVVELQHEKAVLQARVIELNEENGSLHTQLNEMVAQLTNLQEKYDTALGGIAARQKIISELEPASAKRSSSSSI